MFMHYEEFLLTCDALIRAGKIREVSDLIQGLNMAQLPREFRQAVGKVCRRSGLIDHGLRVLQSLVRNEKPLDVPATPSEICEYAVLLSRNGSIQEALELLEQIETTSTPEALLYQGFCHISQWNYKSAATCFENFLKSEIDDYSKLIAQINLAATYVAHRQLEAAESLLVETLTHAADAKATRLLGNGLELKGQVAFFRGDFKTARAELAHAAKILGTSGSYDQLLIHKWESTMQALEERSVGPILKFREEAIRQKHWESVRDTDSYRLKIQFDQRTFDHLMFGTPSEFYRQRVMSEIAGAPSANFNYGSTEGPQLDLQTGILQQAKLPPTSLAGKKIHQTLAALIKDFYAPRNLGSLFAEIYPEEYFDVNSSPLRVRQLLRRTRRWLEASQLPVVIQEDHGGYQLKLLGAVGFNLHYQRAPVDVLWTQWQGVMTAFTAKTFFTAEEISRKLKISRTSTHRLLTWAVSAGKITASGVNKATVYHLSSKPILKAA